MVRLDTGLVTKGLAGSRGRASKMIKSGGVSVNGKIILKPSYSISDEDEITILQPDMEYVGRGALKLEKAVEEFGIDLNGKKCIDIGASTGGFTDFMLRNGASIVFAVDVGHGQLAPVLKDDSRVINAEGMDIRDVTETFTDGKADFISADVSFISLKKILPKMYELLKDDSYAVALIKPQFEAGRENIGKHGIVKDRRVHEHILTDIDSFASGIGFCPESYIYSPVKGGSGNIEYLVKLYKGSGQHISFDFRTITGNAFTQL
jgi:23S rRNA (cytidine1920-2'-O)/16S rRNA (cytidine1409-2'-O)-methyltransferase